MNRDEIIRSIKESPQIPVLIIGAGINGIGTFRDLALNKVETLLIDRGDFCSGASSASSHMAHGGIRYLENGEFRLVEEAVQERNRMIENAPHIVKPLPTTIPIFKFWSGLLNAPLKFLNLLDRPSERGALVIKIGLIFYDSFTRKQKTVPRHQFHGRKESLEKYPYLNPEIQYTATYFDGQILSPERYAIDLIRDAEAEGNHAKALNYCSIVSVDGKKVVLKDEITGNEINVCPKLIINAAGPWIDQVNQSMGITNRYIGGTKGSHLVLNNPDLRKAIGDHEFFFENKDGRIVLIFPFYDKVIVGTSDLAISNPDDARCTPEEEDYFIELISRVFPSIPVKKSNIVFRFTGVRPLEYSKAKTTGQITRDHSIKEDTLGDVPVFSLVGGKWTSYRAFSSQTAAKVMEFLHFERQLGTEEMPVGGGKNYPGSSAEKDRYIAELSRINGIKVDYAAILFDRYGTHAEEIASYIQSSGAIALKSLPDWTVGEVEFLIESEKIQHLDDLLIRRSTIGWLGRATPEVIEEISALLGKKLKWDDQKISEEIKRTKEILRDHFGIN